MRVFSLGSMAPVVVRVFEERGHIVRIREDAEKAYFVARRIEQFDLLIAFPPCRYLCSSGLHWNTRRPERAAKTEASLELVRFILELDVPRICLENPLGCIGTRIRPADQIVQPYDYGYDASKRTGLWLKNLPRLIPTEYVPPRIAQGRERWGNQFDDGQNNESRGNRQEKRRGHLEAFIVAMADQWGAL